jgi:predicted nucleotidyltransferase
MVERSTIRLFCKAVAKQFRPRKIILFGSYAYGKPTENSDVDLLVVMARTRYRGERMSIRIRKAMPASFPMDLIVRTPAEISKRLFWGDSFMREIVEKGKTMYESADA